MIGRAPPQGSIVAYPYLWASQRDSGESEGRKERPVCLLLKVYDRTQDIHHLVLLAISSQPPAPDQIALEIPDIERRRGGLIRYPRAWIVISEYNYDIAEWSFYYNPNSDPLGAFSTAYLREIATAFRANLRMAATRVDRTV
jgi:hypothetical protein